MARGDGRVRGAGASCCSWAERCRQAGSGGSRESARRAPRRARSARCAVRQAADECRGLPVCIPVAGPWVVIPATTSPDDLPAAVVADEVPGGQHRGGVDARLTNRAVDMSFSGLLGAPSPGITTRTRSSSPARTRAMHCGRPGSGPSSGAFRRRRRTHPDRRQARVTDKLRVRTVSFRTTATANNSCSRGERLISSARAARSGREPGIAQLAGVRSELVSAEAVWQRARR